MDMFHVDIILLVILCFLTIFMCGYGVYCVYRLLVSLQMQILLRPTRVLFSHKKEGQSQAELRTVVAYQNPFSGDYCVHKSRHGARGYLNTTPSPDSGLSDEYEPLHQPALASVKPDNQLGFEPLYRQNDDPKYKQNVESAYKQNVESAYRQDFESAYKKNIESAYKQNVESAYGQNVESAYMPNLDPSYQRREDSLMSNVEHDYHQPLQSDKRVEGCSNIINREMDPGIMVTMEPAYHARDKPGASLNMNGGLTSARLTSTQSLDTPQPLRLGWITHLRSAFRKPHHHLKTSSMPSVEDNVIDRTWNWNYKEYQI